jgi:hypothetical protein
MTAGAVITATTRTPWHCGQVSGSTSKIRRSSSAHRARAARSDQATGSTTVTAAAGPSRRRAPRVGLAYQP